ncbi:MAG TPA: CopD family protein [Dissulfurispiraceae bacterium]|nr:CopD family protein [Dissulfurispiraceae bacterium]
MSVLHAIPEWVELIALVFCIGTLVLFLWILPRNRLISAWRAVGICMALFLAGGIAEVLMRSMEMSGQPFSEICSVLPIVLFRTHYGHVWLVRIATIMLMTIMLAVGGRARDSRIFQLIMLTFALVTSMTISASGHASDKGDFSIYEIMDWLHLIAVSVWGGGLFVLSIVILPGLTGSDDRQEVLIADVSRRFSRMAGIAVGIVTITAIYNYLVYVGSFHALMMTPYGLTIIVKIILLFILVNLGGFNRYVSVPLLQEWGGASAEGRGTITRTVLRFYPRLQLDGSGHRITLRFMRCARTEAALIVCVLLCAALLRHGVPARHFAHMQHSGKEMSSDQQHHQH